MKLYNKILFTFSLLLILFFSGYYNYSQPMGYENYLQNPLTSDGKVLTISGIITAINNNYYTIFDGPNNKEIMVLNYFEKWKEGDFVSIKGIFHKEGYIEYLEGEVVWDRKIKFILSIAGFLAVILIIYIDRKKVVISL